MRSKDNRGASFVMVIVAMAIVAILAVTVLWIALINLQMKTTDVKNTDNFYSAEGVLDQICTGLQEDISTAYSTGYTEVMQNYSTSENNEAKRQSTFSNAYIKKLKTLLQADSTGMTYNMTKLKGYVAAELLDDSSYPYAKITSTSAAAGSDNGILSTYTNRTVIKGIKVEYTDEKGYKSIIETDISLAVPSMSFTASGGVPELFTYSLIGNDGFEISKGISKVELAGNLYAGSDYAVGSGSSTTSITIPDNSVLSVSDSSYLIAEGDIEVGDHENLTASTSNNSKFNVDAQCQLWTDNINVNGATVNLEGTTYVSDDMTLRGVGSKVTLGKNNSGKYIGFGNDPSVAADSSAIIINGRNASLDMSGLEELMLAGTAYINTSAIVNGSNVGTDNSNVTMGESISVKGDQIAYLVPAECIGTEGTGADAESLYNKNPLSFSEYQDITASSSDQVTYEEINDQVVSQKTGKALSEYLAAGSKIEDCVRKVFVPSSDGNSNSGLVYYYINLPTDKAAQYYEDYYNADSSKLQKYTEFYTKNIQVSDAASIYTAGNCSIYDGQNLSLMKGIADGIDLDAESESIKQTYTALNSKLITNYADLPANATTVSLFTNIINDTNMTELVGHKAGKTQTFETDYQGKTYKAVVVDGDYTFDSNAKKQNVSVIVATGDVNIETDFTGTIVAKGKIIVKSSCKIDNGTQEIFKALLLAAESEDTDAKHLYDVFMDGSAYLGNISKFSDKTMEDTKIDYSDLITYQNWTKE